MLGKPFKSVTMAGSILSLTPTGRCNNSILSKGRHYVDSRI